MSKIGSGFGELATLSQHVSSVCSTCGDLRETSKPLSTSLKAISVSAKQGCKSCMVIYNSYTHVIGRSYGISSGALANVAFQIPVLDMGYPMGIASSDDDGWYSWNEIYTKSSAVKAPWPLIGQALERKNSALEAIPVLKGWIETCLTSHPECASQTRPLPTRVLDVSGGSISLYISQNDTEPYVALSHCWGKSHVIQTHRSTLQSRILDIEWRSLSKTFQDAITTTRELGIRYLWIDSLCIIQDDPRDWMTESGNMASIYEGAQVVIAASEATDGHDGFLKARSSTPPSRVIFEGSNPQNESYEIRVREGDDHRWYGNLLPPRSHFSPDSSRLSTRGWAFQERLLATRYVQFRSQELVWECRSCLWCECGVLSRASQQRTVASQQAFYKSLLSSHNDTIFSLWSRIVNTYCRKALTNRSDTLPALSGLAKRFQIVGAGNYLAGLWQEDLPLCLLWEAHAARAVPYRAPSWSWASMDTSLEGSYLVAESTSDSKASAPTTVLVAVDAVSCTYDAADPTGRVSAGSLTLTGKTVQIVPLHRGEDYEYGSPYDWAARRLRFAQHVDSNGIITGWATRRLHSERDAKSNGANSEHGFGPLSDGDLKEEVLFKDTEHACTEPGPTFATTPNDHLPRVSRRRRTLLGVGQAATPELTTESIQGSITREGHMNRLPHELSKQTTSNSPHGASMCDTSCLMSMGNAMSKLDSPGLEGCADLEQEVSTPQISRHKVTATSHVLKVNQKENLRRQSNMSLDPYTSTFGFHADSIISNLDKYELTCILIGETSGAPRALVLRRLDSRDTDECFFERVGLIDRIILGSSIRSNAWESLFHDAPSTTVTIV